MSKPSNTPIQCSAETAMVMNNSVYRTHNQHAPAAQMTCLTDTRATTRVLPKRSPLCAHALQLETCQPPLRRLAAKLSSTQA
jgi:hypothetical protein